MIVQINNKEILGVIRNKDIPFEERLISVVKEFDKEFFEEFFEWALVVANKKVTP